MQHDDDLLTVPEVAALLRVSPKTAYTLVQAGDLPGFKAGGQWRFRRLEIDAWMAQRASTHRPAERKNDEASDRQAPNVSAPPADKTGSLGFEDTLWAAADVLRNNMDPAEYKHVVLGLIFLKYISDAFEERREQIIKLLSDPESREFVADLRARDTELGERLEDRDEYTAENVFWVPHQARWPYLRGQAKQPDIGTCLDAAMDAIEADNRALKGALPRVYALPALDKHRLGELIDLISGIGLGTAAHREKDTLGRVYEYFLSRFASAEGRGGGEFYTPSSLVWVLVEMLEPYEGRVYDPCCGSGGMFVQSLKFITAHGGRRDAVTVYGQESNATTWRMARMNMAIRGIEAKLGEQHGDTFHRDLHPDLRADFVLANPPFNVSNWGGERLAEDVRWKQGTPPAGNANFAWLQHIVHHLSPTGSAGVVLANGSLSTQQSGEGDIRRKLVEDGLVDCMVAMPGQLFYSVQIPVCLWFFARSRDGSDGRRDRSGEVLFLDARRLGRMETRVHRVFDAADIEAIAGTYHAWRNVDGAYEDVPGFCKSASLAEIAAHDFVLTPGRYVGAAEVEEDGEPFEVKMERLVEELDEARQECSRLDVAIQDGLSSLGFSP